MNTKPPNKRYSALKKVGSGDFATTFSAHDNRLNRDVAIKQLHSQYLDDQSKLARYWREAQLLASLEHPNNMTIYDVDRSRGRLVLELMAGSLRQIYEGRPMPVEDVRQTLIQALKGLQCLHDNGIVHGDVNPNNLFLSRQDVVKLGDFGLARRVEDDEGSLLKGTTRYMAPELVSEEFGKVGPKSDLYSLGFSALDLMVGPEFETLFPDLIAFGRDRKMAWMMWHCSADRKLPPVDSMLDGVPTDLAKVITRLTAKDQSRRYQSAEEALQDLSANPVPVGRSLKQEKAAAAELNRKKLKARRQRKLIICALSVLLSGLIYWMALERPAPPERVAPPPTRGIVQNVLPIDGKLVLDVGADWKEIKLRQNDVVTLNRKQRQLRDLEQGDRVVVHTRLDPDDNSHLDVIAFRPESHTGVIQSVDPEKKSILVKVTEGTDENKEFSMLVPDQTPIEINKQTTEKGGALTFGSLAAGDEVVVEHSDDEDGMLALNIEALRSVDLQGFVRELDTKRRVITVALVETEDNADSFVKVPLSSSCVFTLNELTSLNNKLVGFGDLQPGDRVTVRHDATAWNIDAYRVFREQGRVESIDYLKQTIRVSRKGSAATTYALDPTCEILLGGKTIQLDDLRVNDTLDVSHDSPGESVPKLDRISASRPADNSKWAILIGNQSFDDEAISPLNNSLTNVHELQEVLTERYAIPSNQTFVCEDFVRVRLEQEVPGWLTRMPAGSELYVYLGTHAVRAIDQEIYFATKDSSIEKMHETGLSFDWFIDLLDKCQVDRKLLFLDCTHPVANPVSPAEIMLSARKGKRGGYPRTLYVLGSCQEGQVGTVAPAKPIVDLFASVIASGFAGGADEPRDNRIEITELAKYIERTMNSAGTSGGISQLPILYLPDATPPRISSAARQAILGLLAHVEDRKLDLELVFKEAELATQLSEGQPDANLALGIVLIKHTKMPQALELLEELRLKHPDLVLAQRAVIWLHFNKSYFDAGFEKLHLMLTRVPVNREIESGYDAESLAIFEWAGKMRELAGSVDWSDRVPSAEALASYDQAIDGFGAKAVESHNRGREMVRATMAGYDEEIKSNPDGLTTLVRQRFRNYVESIADQDAVASIRNGLDK